ncbi:MAG TPA: YgiQ family radical SAM protein [Pseudothermotoga sp.]|nr:YgiQ family radical SAM protein [Pseudothermotoga sp.]HOK84323.1 YgiQ family radical SAM protein [Pseudothermotoga sp.]HPP70735.1 YgiQ family radical SAM protein [Pseudothermotoga sp.]
MFLPTTVDEMQKLGWRQLDVILISGDAYVDHPSFGVVLIGHYLVQKGYKVGIIAQPDWHTERDITRLGRPRLFFGVTAGNVDSMVANYTASMKKRKNDEYSPNGVYGKRPDRATIVYSNLVRRFFPDVPIVLGGLEASLRRFAHYDWWSDKIRKSVLVDAKADLLVYGMAEKTVFEIAQTLEKTGDIEKCRTIRGIVWWTSRKPDNCYELPSFEEIVQDRRKYAQAVKLQTVMTDPFKGYFLCQKQDTRYVVQNPPCEPLDQRELDELYLLPYERRSHPYYEKTGKIPALDMIQFSVTCVRGCFGSCSFCALTQHQTTHVVSRSVDSVLEEVKLLTKHSDFHGTVTDVGGPTANMYGSTCSIRETKGQCERFCLYPKHCVSAKPNHGKYLELLYKIKDLPGVKHVFVSSGIRHDLVLHDPDGERFIKELVNFTPGQLKLAPEHSHPKILALMRKPPVELFLEFRDRFERYARSLGKKRYVIGYFIVAHPGETMRENEHLRRFIEEELSYHPQQIQIFTPSPGTLSTAMYYSQIDPFTEEQLYVEKSLKMRNLMKQRIIDNHKTV